MAVKSADVARKGDKPPKGAKASELKNSGFTAEEEMNAYRDLRLMSHMAEKACKV